MMRKSVYVFLSCFLLSGCGMIDYHPYDVRISGETEVNAHNIERIEANCQGKTTEFGARPVKRAIQRYLLNDLSKKLLSQEVDRSKAIIVDADGDGLVFRN